MAPSHNSTRQGLPQHLNANDSDGEATSRDLAALDQRFPHTSSSSNPQRVTLQRSPTDPAHDRARTSEPYLRPGSNLWNSESSSRNARVSNNYELQPIPSRADGDGTMGATGDSPTTNASSILGSAKGNSSKGPKSSLRADVRTYIRNKRAKKQGRKRNLTWGQRMGDFLRLFYQKVIIESILRRRPLPPSKDGRHIPLNSSGRGSRGLIDERNGKPYINNFIRSSRYTIYDFIPKQLIFQFSKLGNFYFLVMGALQLVPGLSTVGKWTTIAPLAVFIAFSMAKEGYDDFRRYMLDKVENKSETWVLADRLQEKVLRHAEKRMKKKEKEGETGDEVISDDVEAANTVGSSHDDWVSIQWQHIRIGDVIRLRRDDAVPADIILLHATGPNGVAYIETAALDGETNLKSKQACTLLAERCETLDGLRSTQATIVSEDPNLDLYSYDGRVTVDGETVPLSMNNVVYRGSTLRNTTEAIGIIVNSGEECKIRMNANKNVTAKKPAMQGTINRMVLIQIVIVLSLAVGLTVGYDLWKSSTENRSWYIKRYINRNTPNEQKVYDARVPYRNIFFGYAIMFNTLIPLSLYISLEIIKLGQLILLQDVEMYDPVSDTPMVANTTTILENLGQVSYVFSDKTGTLTENLMRFRKLSVAGIACLHDLDVERDEETRRKKVEAREKSKKGKAKDLSRASTTRRHDPRHDDETLPGDDLGDMPPIPMRNSSTRSVTRWKSSVNMGGCEPIMKTEDLLDYIRRRPSTTFSKKVKHFLLCIALCHTCLPEHKDDGSIAFQAASPDELALVEAARDLGYMLIDRPAQSIKLETRDAEGNPRTEVYQVLDVIEFSSKRKRMSIVIRMPDARICVFCKGADNVIMSRLKLSNLAEQKFQENGRRKSLRRTTEQDKHIRRMSAQDSSAHNSPRSSIALMRGESSNRVDSLRLNIGKKSLDLNRLSQQLARSPRPSVDMLGSPSPRLSLARRLSPDASDRRIDESIASSDGALFEKCFQHIDEFASEGLRTLLYAYRYIDEDAYAQWKEKYREAETSLIDRQKHIEEAGELIEQKFELAGATAIEDKLQEGVPATIDKLRRANIKVWMLTGDKRETAINIGHSARVCKPYSELYILDRTLGDLKETMTVMLNDVCRGMVPHSVVVVDGQTLTVIDADEDLAVLFYDLVIRVDSVICCRASPSQKAKLVKSIRRYVPKSMTLAIGDGANDIGMIQASHVGIGISGREGLQAARISDFSIAQFRFLQRMLFVHGRWNYMRTGKYVLGTFWKEMLFFLVQAHFQRFNGYSGTSLYESWSLTVFNSAFTSLPVILLGIFEKDLRADTLLAVPELYMFGQQGHGFSFVQYFGWMIMGIGGSFLIWYFTYEVFRETLFDGDTSLFAMGMVGFTVSVLFINIKLLILELHNKTIVTFAGFLISVAGWFLWMLALSGIKARTIGPYIVRDAFIDNFGRRLRWWATVLVELIALIVVELVVQAVRRVYWPTDQDLMQRIERDTDIKSIFKENARAADLGDDDVDLDDERERQEDRGGGQDERRGRPELTMPQYKEKEKEKSPPTSGASVDRRKTSRMSDDGYRLSNFGPLEEERDNPRAP